MVVKLILLIDIGNTNIVLGISKDNQIINTFRYVTNSLLTEDDYYQKISLLADKYNNTIIDVVSSIINRAIERMEKQNSNSE